MQSIADFVSLTVLAVTTWHISGPVVSTYSIQGANKEMEKRHFIKTLDFQI